MELVLKKKAVFLVALLFLVSSVSIATPVYANDYVGVAAEGRAFVRLGDGSILSGPATLVCELGFTEDEEIWLWVEGALGPLKWDLTGLIEPPARARAGVIRLKAKVWLTGPPVAPAPISVRISRLKEGGRVSASGRGVQFAGQIFAIDWPKPPT